MKKSAVIGFELTGRSVNRCEQEGLIVLWFVSGCKQFDFLDDTPEEVFRIAGSAAGESLHQPFKAEHIARHSLSLGDPISIKEESVSWL